MKRENYILLLLTGYFSIAHLDRHILTIVLEPIRNEFALTDLQLGLLSGFAFALLFSILTIPFAVIAPKFNQRIFIASTIAAWSFMTFLTGMATSFGQIMLARMGVSIGEAAAFPASHTIISQEFPANKRTTSFSIFISGGNIGMAIALVVGGIITHQFGWRVAMFAAGVPGLVLACVIYFTMPEIGLKSPPVPRLKDTDKAPSKLKETLIEIYRDPPMRLTVIGATFSAITTFGVAAWLASLLIREHAMSLPIVGLYIASIVGLFGMAGTQAVGRLADILTKRQAAWVVWLPALLLLMTKPFAIAGFLANDQGLALLLLAVPSVLGNCYFASSLSVLHTRVSPVCKPTSSALLITLVNFIGMGCGPLVVGLVSNYWSPGGGGLGMGLVAVQLFGFIGIAAYYFAGKQLSIQDTGKIRK